ncbi:di-heme oxidoredictase family protein, partial [Oceanospirillum sp. HFRX-1_2]
MRFLRNLFLGVSLVMLGACGGSGGEADNNDANTLPALGPVGGIATTNYEVNKTFLSQLIPDLDLASAGNVSQGEQLFMANWVTAPSSRELFDGLGPLFIADSCAACHLPTARAKALNSDGSTDKGILFRLLDREGIADAHLGVQFQNQATTGSAEGSVLWREKPAGGLEFYLSDSSSLVEDKTQLAPRLSPQLYGVGLLALVDEAQIADWADEYDINKDGISGRVHWLASGDTECIGRFGWKAIHCSLTSQVGGAFNQDMGLTSTLFPDENCASGQSVCSD